MSRTNNDMQSLPPKAVKTKIYKTGQTRGADDDVIFQNRVSRNSTVLIPYHDYQICKKAPTRKGEYENGFIVLIKPEDYFQAEGTTAFKEQGLKLGENLLVFYETRYQWEKYPILKNWKPASSRNAPLRGQYVARIPATTSENEKKINRGFTTSRMKGAGIRVYEYADTETIKNAKLQLEFLFWSCKDIEQLAELYKIDKQSVVDKKMSIRQQAEKERLIDKEQLIRKRIIDSDGYTICPLCLKQISAIGFCSKIPQAEGREVPDLTVTEVSLFHIHELRTGEFNHRPYNLGWGHHHCNVVVKDAGIDNTLQWMLDVLKRNDMVK